MKFPHAIEYKIFDFGKDFYLLFIPQTSSLFKIDNTMKDVIDKSVKLKESEISEHLDPIYGGESVKQAISELKSIKESGFMGTDKELCFIRPMRENSFQRLELHISNDCNMKCAYCFAEGGSYGQDVCSKNMKWETAKKTIDWFLDLNKGKDTALSIQFFGGEPLLNIDVLEKSLGYIQKYKKEGFNNFIHLVIGTNGTLLDDKSIDILAKHNCIPWISIDFSKKDHDKNRVYRDGRGTYDDIVSGIKRLKKRAPDLPIVLCPTFEKKEDITDIYKLKEELGAEQVNFKFNFSLYDGRAVPDKDFYTILEKCRKDLDEIFEYCLNKDIPFEILPDYRFYHLHAGRNVYLGCGAGKNRIAVNSDGDIFMCSVSMMRQGKIGNIFNGLNEETLKKIDSMYKNALDRHGACVDCWIRRLCNGMCVASNHITSTKYGESRGCDIGRFINEFLLKSYATLEAKDIKRIFGARKNSKEALRKINLLYDIRDLRNQKLKHIKHLTPVSEALIDFS